MAVAGHVAYLDHAAVSPLPAAVGRAMADYLDCRRTMDASSEDFLDISTRLQTAVAKLLNATPEEIGFVQNTSHGLNLAAQSLPLARGDNVIFCDMEFPSNVYPWMLLEAQRGVEARCIPHDRGGLTIEALERHVDDRTRVVAVSSVEFLTGFRTDLEAVGGWCQDRGIYLVVDAIQSLGAIPMDVRACHVDFLASGGPKWLMGPVGIGFVYCRAELLEQLVPPMAGCMSVVGWEDWRDYDLTFQPDARRFQLGGPNIVGMVGLLAAIDLLMRAGIEDIHHWTLRLTDLLVDDLRRRGYQIVSNRDPDRRSAIVSFSVPGDPAAVHAGLKAAGVVASVREEYIRVSPHGYNTEEEIARVGEVLGEAQI
jgi:selenocysteine lyase/cysteine desulfurase